MRFVHIQILPLALLLLWSPGAQAAQWSAEPTVSLRSGYNDNYRLTTGPHDSVWEADLTPAVKFGVETGNQGLFGYADVSIDRFYGGSGDTSSSLLDREDYHFRVNSYQQTERNNFGGNVEFTRDSTLDTEVNNGQVFDNLATRSSTTLNPTWSRMLDEKTSLDFDYAFNRVDYSDIAGTSGLVNYDFNTASVSLVRQFTPLLQGTLSTSVSRYLPNTKLDSDTYAIQVGLSRKHTETVSTSWLAGWRNTSSDTLVPTGFCVGADPGAGFPKCTGGQAIQTGTDKDNTSDTGAVYAATITKTLERGSLSASASRLTEPSGTGGLLDTTRLSLSGEHRLTETLTSRLSLDYYENDTIVNSSGGSSQTKPNKYFSIHPSLAWQWQPEWTISGEYQYAENKTSGSSNSANQNAVYLTLTYSPTRMFMSR